MRILFLGDLVGRGGRNAVIERLPDIRRDYGVDFAIVNCENAAGGFGVTRAICDELFSAGADVLTSGNHIWDQRETIDFIDDEPRLLRPLNFVRTTPGHGCGLFEAKNGQRVLVVNAMGQLFMDMVDDPFVAVEQALDGVALGEDVDAIVIDVHAEATSEKMSMGHFADGRASFVVGTHTHVPTADAQILPFGTAYHTDAGMCGDYDSVIGMDKTNAVARFARKLPAGRLTPSMGEATICGTLVDVGADGLATAIEPFRLGGRLQPADGGLSEQA